MVDNVMLGGGYASGMFYTAPAGTALPAYPTDTLTGWTIVGDIDADGIAFTARDSKTLKNWALQPKRTIPGSDPGTIKGKIMDITENTLKTVFGSSNVTKTAATVDHGTLLKVNLDSKPDPAAFLFIMKDGERMTYVGTSNGLISDLGDINYKGDEAVELDITIQGDWVQVTDEGDDIES